MLMESESLSVSLSCFLCFQDPPPLQMPSLTPFFQSDSWLHVLLFPVGLTVSLFRRMTHSAVFLFPDLLEINVLPVMIHWN